jgi:hypothetical protein
MKSPLSIDARQHQSFPIKKLAKRASVRQPSSLLFIAPKLERLSAITLKRKHPEDAVREASQTRPFFSKAATFSGRFFLLSRS